MKTTRSASICKHAGVRESLRRMIATGEYAPGSKLPPENELPKKMRVSKITVVRALNDLAREGVIVRRRGSGSYVADPAQRPLMPGRFLKLGILMPHSVFADYRYGPQQNAVLNSILESWGLADVVPEFPKVAEAEATRARWTSERRGCCVEVVGEEEKVLLKHPPLDYIREARFDGILSLSIVEEDWISELLKLGVPTVLMDYPNERFGQADQVFFDPFPGYCAAVREFVARGLRRIHFLGGLRHLPYPTPADAKADKDYYSPHKALRDPDSHIRQSAWRQSMADAGIHVPPEWVHFTWAEDKYAAELGMRLVELPAEQRPEAFVCHNHGQAEALIEVFHQRGVPLAGAGAAGSLRPGRAAPILADNHQMGRTGAALLQWKLQQSAPALRVGVPMTLNGANPVSAPSMIPAAVPS
jgi:DNA-binding LacI/PurR family transcriptional regulator/DNA-binding transcriptional regulator YhcF (GntR family)